MNEITNIQQTGLTVLDSLAAEAKIYSESLAMNMFQLGRVYTEAKKLVKHGEWTDWIRDNGGMSERSAQQLMAVYVRFGSRPAFHGIEKSKLFKMLSLPAGTEDDFVAENDVDELSSREVENAVKEMRERAERAEKELERLNSLPPQIPDDIADILGEKDKKISEQQSELERVATQAGNMIEETRKLQRENSRLNGELKEHAELLNEAQDECNRAQSELLNMQSAIAKGDAERVPGDELTADVFATAVRQFIGTVARMPHMGRTFGSMRTDEKATFDELLTTVESWATEARKAINTIESEVITV